MQRHLQPAVDRFKAIADEAKREAVGADSILSHRADPILSQGWEADFERSAVVKFRALPGSLISSMLC
jgi:hypothetical protein